MTLSFCYSSYQWQSWREHSNYSMLNSYFSYHCSLQHSDHLTFACTTPYLPAESASYSIDTQYNRSSSGWSIEEHVSDKINFGFCWITAVAVYDQMNMIVVCYLAAWSLVFCSAALFTRIHLKHDRIVINFDW